ncbi:MAG: branched-chain amino acid transport system substrate-binding protein [Chloroflexota bacterium]|jgi:branched-chain amino acid transport system substrate-binding protein|nr:branched-chain amino acid transport system substrate-binding protein [Chloroflexota bacterium]
MLSIRGAALASVALIGLAACGGSTSTGGSKGTVKIGIDLPLSGNETSNGVPTKNGALFAIKQANDKGGVEGFKVEAVVLDDAVNGKHDPQQGAKNVQQFVADTGVLAMVGPFNSNVARAEMPIASTANLPMISPSNTGECLTQTHPYCTNGEPASLHPGGKTFYFRVCTTDNIQGPALADYATKTLKKTKVYILDDRETYGKGLADNFEKQFKTDGGTVAGHEGFDAASTDDFKSFLNKAKAAGVDLLFFGGTDTNKAGIIRNQMKGIIDVPYMGGDGIQTDQFLKDASTNADGSYASVAAVNADKLAAAKTFLDGFKAYKSLSTTDYGAYTANAYDATNIIIQAIGTAIKANGGNMPDREAVRKAIGAVDYNGAIGHTTFDNNGDTSNKIISFYQVTGGKWAFVDQITFKG